MALDVVGIGFPLVDVLGVVGDAHLSDLGLPKGSMTLVDAPRAEEICSTLGTTVGNLGWEEVAFPKPVFAGDTIRAETTVVALRDSKSRPLQGIVTFAHTGLNQRGEVIATCRRVALMMRRPA